MTIDEKVYTQAESMLDNEGTLLYLSEFGSQLYGTADETSDKDFRGIFLPSKRKLYLGTAKHEINFTTGNQDSKNNSEDLDLKLYSLQKFLSLLGEGETGAMDLLFSTTIKNNYVNPECPLFMSELVHNIPKLINANTMKAYYGYAMAQAKRYGIKGSRYNRFLEVYGIANGVSEKLRVADIIPMLELVMDKSECFVKEDGDEKYLVLGGKLHDFTVSIGEFKKRISKTIDEYGNRVKENTVDWKSLSHAIRALDQLFEFFTTGQIHFPLKTAKHLYDVKKGYCNFDEVLQEIEEKLDLVQLIQKTNLTVTKDYAVDENLVANTIISLYDKFAI